jgi:hypothetical protein
MQPDRQPNYWQDDSHESLESSANLTEGSPRQTPIVTMNPEPLPQQDVSLQIPVSDTPVINSQEPIRWEANEYIHQEKNGLWFVGFAVITLVMMLIAIALMHAWSFAVLIAVMAAAVVVYSQRPPRLLTYTLSGQGLHVGDRLYSFTEFKAFGIIRDGQEYSVMLIPMKRFSPGVTVYFPEEQGERIVDMLGARLPMQELHLDIVDKIVRKLRL